VVFSDWRELEGRQIPFARTEFHPESGEESRWRFDAAELRDPEDSKCKIPDAVLQQLVEGEEEDES
jgi:hypothetical protein